MTDKYCMADVRSTPRNNRETIAHRADIVVIAYFENLDGTRTLMRSIANPPDTSPMSHNRGIIRMGAY